MIIHGKVQNSAMMVNDVSPTTNPTTINKMVTSRNFLLTSFSDVVSESMTLSRFSTCSGIANTSAMERYRPGKMNNSMPMLIAML